MVFCCRQIGETPSGFVQERQGDVQAEMPVIRKTLRDAARYLVEHLDLEHSPEEWHLSEIVKFREMLEQRVERGDPALQAVPEEHQPVIAKLVHERCVSIQTYSHIIDCRPFRSDKTLSALAKYVYHQLIPAQEDLDEKFKSSPFASSFPMSVVEAAIKSVASRNNYGLDGVVAGKAPAAICAWRWEVKEECSNWLPKAALEKAEARRLERIQVHVLVCRFRVSLTSYVRAGQERAESTL
jgi:hypothetical protein